MSTREPKDSPVAIMLRRMLIEEIKRVTVRPPAPATLSPFCNWAVTYNDGRGDLLALGSVIRRVSTSSFPLLLKPGSLSPFVSQCSFIPHEDRPCAELKDYTQSLSLNERVLIMVIIVLWERETGRIWSLTHRASFEFTDSMPSYDLPPAGNGLRLGRAVKQIYHSTLEAFCALPGTPGVSRRLHPRQEGLLGWRDFGSEDGSYNPSAHSESSPTPAGSQDRSSPVFREKTRDTDSYAPSVVGSVEPSQPSQAGTSKATPASDEQPNPSPVLCELLCLFPPLPMLKS